MSTLPPPDPQGVCKRRVWPDYGHPHDCRRPVVEQGLCARHLAGERRSQKAAAKRKESIEWREQMVRRSSADWLEGQDYDGSEDFGRGFMHAVRLLRGEA